MNYLVMNLLCLFIFCEYVYVQGNSNGDVCLYWDLFYKKGSCIQGGFIWDFVDQGVCMLLLKEFIGKLGCVMFFLLKIEFMLKNGKINQDWFFVVGGDFGFVDMFSDGMIGLDGIVDFDCNFISDVLMMVKVY